METEQDMDHMVDKASESLDLSNNKRKRVESEEGNLKGGNQSRTPSGTEISANVKDIRSFFTAKQQKLNSEQSSGSIKAKSVVKKYSQRGAKVRGQPRLARAVSGQVKHKLLTRSRKLKNRSTTLTTTKGQRVKANSVKDDCVTTDASCSSYFDTSADESDFLTPGSVTRSVASDQEDMMLSAIAANMKEVSMEQIQQSLKQHIERMQNLNGEQTEANSDTSAEIRREQSKEHPVRDIEQNEEDNPRLISISAVLQMFKKIQSEVNEAVSNQKQKVEERLMNFKQEIIKDVSTAVSTGLQHNQEQDNLKAELYHWKHKSEVLTDTVERLNTDISELVQRMDNVELNNVKKSVIISGLPVAEKKGQNWLMLDQLFSEGLNLEIEIEDFYTLGPNFVVSFNTMETKRQVMKNKYMLKDMQGPYNIFINDYLPPAVQEKRRREKDIIAKCQESDVSYSKAGLVIRGIPYRKKVQPPTPKQLVNMDIKDLERILKIKLKKDAEITQEKSIFSAYTAEVSSHAAIREMYQKMKLIQPGARHIVCSYYIDHQEEHYSQDYHDDGEPGAGRVALNILTQNNVKNRVVFIARKYGGVKMGSERFQCYAEVTKAALLTHGIKINHYVKRQQQQRPPVAPLGNDLQTQLKSQFQQPPSADWSTQDDQSHTAVQQNQPRSKDWLDQADSNPPYEWGAAEPDVPRTRSGGFNHRYRAGPQRRGFQRGRRNNPRGVRSSTQRGGNYGLSYQDYKTKGYLYPNVRSQQTQETPKFHFSYPQEVSNQTGYRRSDVD